eukprot:scaffold11355_cov59-Phaeocystis_antarctica.AAC.5
MHTLWTRAAMWRLLRGSSSSQLYPPSAPRLPLGWPACIVLDNVRSAHGQLGFDYMRQQLWVALGLKAL